MKSGETLNFGFGIVLLLTWTETSMLLKCVEDLSNKYKPKER